MLQLLQAVTPASYLPFEMIMLSPKLCSVYIQYLCAINCSAYCEVCCGDGTPSPCSLSIWEMYCTAWWKGLPAAYTCSRNFFWEAKHSSDFGYKWCSRVVEVLQGAGDGEPPVFWWDFENAHLFVGVAQLLELFWVLCEQQSGLLVASVLPCGPDVLLGEEDLSVLSTLTSLCRCRKGALSGLYSVVLLSEEGWKGCILVG